ncbi:MAG: class I SAM-dependent methyltransferase [Christensenellaceae bacterium]|jgi:hypothetical protein|nr:class I SAM-dependent methyltransferase [Christensenellaceae bacterium]
MVELKNARFLGRDLMRDLILEGDMAIDATAGNGHDALFLCRQVGETGLVHVFDVQEEALKRTRERLEAEGMLKRAKLHLRSHAEMADVVEGRARAVLFNLGWLPGGDHEKTTRAESSAKAVEAALELLLPGGMAFICVYPGHEEGRHEMEMLTGLAKGLDPRRFNALFSAFLNQREDSPKLIAIQRNMNGGKEEA